MSTTILSTVVDYATHDESGAIHSPPCSLRNSTAPARSGSTLTVQLLAEQTLSADAPPEELEMHVVGTEMPPPADDPEFRLPNRASLVMVITTNALLDFGFYVTVSSATLYFINLNTIHLIRAQGRYSVPLKVAYISLILGSILHAVAYRAHFLYLILIGRIVSGFGFTGFMYIKRYCSDPRIIGIRRRTTLASWLVLGQAFGFSVGPFVGGLLYKIGFSNQVFNGYTSPGWVTSLVTLFFMIGSLYLFEDVPKSQRIAFSNPVELGAASAESAPATPVAPAEVAADEQYGIWQLTRPQWGVIFSMCWVSMSCYFILGSWEANIPIFTAVAFNFTPYAAGNFIALGGVAIIPFLLASVRYSPRFQDRSTLAVGSGIGFIGLLLALILIATDRVVFGSFYVCWVLVALGFNFASTTTLSLLSKQLPNAWNARTSLAIQYSNYCGRVTGAILGGASVQMGMKNYLAVQIGVVSIGALLHLTFWKQLKAKTG
ncbi:hypothetical protein MSAN_00647700 [Mycena sanguinolenta]|uniref:Major facilitator superfamily (MFS) profile domain-containing protein n=1 Tax=Mycena sanguinolenta TaxID=230812 RepID=A0A8H6Z3I6_9AGAR|nr:hypothetical protein MSAN_00647700 [Mycena sanguinolenta]